MPMGIPVLKGKDLSNFERYQKTPGTPKEIKYMKNAEAFYNLHRV